MWEPHVFNKACLPHMYLPLHKYRCTCLADPTITNVESPTLLNLIELRIICWIIRSAYLEHSRYNALWKKFVCEHCQTSVGGKRLSLQEVWLLRNEYMERAMAETSQWQCWSILDATCSVHTKVHWEEGSSWCNSESTSAFKLYRLHS